jgi:hypothetical protein
MLHVHCVCSEVDIRRFKESGLQTQGGNVKKCNPVLTSGRSQ